MRKRLLASLIVCVALLTQLGASLWGATAAQDGHVGCHKPAAASAIADARDANAGSGAPAPHDHASCLLCQLGFTATDNAPPALPAHRPFPYRRALADGAAAPRSRALNWNALARAPPALA